MTFSKILDKALWWSVTLLVASFYIYGSNIYGKYLMMVLTVFILILLIFRYGKNLNFHFSSFHFSILFFISFCLISALWSLVPQFTIEKVQTIFQIFICISVVYIYADKLKTSLPLIDTIRWAGYLLSIYLFVVYGWNELKYLLEESIRIDSELINSNVIGMITAFSLFLTLYKILFFKFSISYLLIIPEIIILAVSSSRKAFVLFILGCLAVIYIKYMKRNILSFFFRSLLPILFFMCIMFTLFSFSIFDSMKNRLEGFTNLFTNTGVVDSSTLKRKHMLQIGMEQFLQNPFIGVGIGCSYEITAKKLNEPIYLHNNYVELLACGGVVGTFIYYCMFLLPAINLFKNRYSYDRNNLVCLTLLLLYLLMDFGMVSYYSKQTYFFLLLFFLQAKINKLENINVTKT